MKPLLLRMQAFGPFANEEIVDFTQLGPTPLFLINGPTGSGKTSILDAICFALYGETTGAERQAMQMRCDLSKPDVLTEVTLEFSLNNKVYRVTRSPEQDAPKARGEGFTLRKHKATLLEISDEEKLITSKTANVKTAVVDIVGLNENQFRQVMVLPQGKFRELLLATSKQREEILGKLFQTDIYKKIELTLKEKASLIVKRKEDFDSQIKGALNVANVISQEELKSVISEQIVQNEKLVNLESLTQIERNNTEAAVKEAERLVDNFSKLAQAEIAFNQHLQDENAYHNRETQITKASQAARLEAPYHRWQLASKQSQTFQKTVIELSDSHDSSLKLLEVEQVKQQTAKVEAQFIPSLRDELQRLEQAKINLLQLEDLKQNISKNSEESVTLMAELKKFIGFKAALSTEAEVREVAYNKAQFDVANIDSVSANIESTQRLLAGLQTLSDMQQATATLAHQKIGLEQNVAQQSSILTLATSAADRMELSWHNAQAAILAHKLTPGAACPVCGSEKHPNIATSSDSEITKEDVQALRTEERNALQNLNDANSQLDQHKVEMNERQRQIVEYKTSLGGEAFIAEQLAQLDVIEHKLLSDQQRLLQLQSIDLSVMKNEIDTLTARCLAGDEKINRQRELIAANQTTLTNMNKQLIELSRTIDKTDETVSAVDKSIVEHYRRIKALETQLEDANKAANDALLSQSNVAAQLAEYQQLFANAAQEVDVSSQCWATELDKSQFNSVDEYQAYALPVAEVERIQGLNSQYLQVKAKLEQTLINWQTELAGKQQPDLEQYYLNFQILEARYSKLRADLNVSSAHLDTLNKVRHDVENLKLSNAKLEQEYQVYGTLYDVASGKTGDRISLHRFVLGVLLDDVLIQASMRLHSMSAGRFILTRKTTDFKGAAGRGLDLMVEDSHSGKSRDVSTLSGGESFLAALSLALGLSDVVQSYSGGIRLDTLFIDEGFGSLDPESLDAAIQTLVELQQSGRMIGVISHVSELKEQMAKRIDVIPSRIGSTIRLGS